MSNSLNRRDFIRTITGGAAAIALSRAALAQDAGARKPNVIYLFSDEHRWQSMSFSELPEVKTPNMKRMADEGVLFSNCVSNYPVCSPHRAILMTGRWPYQQKMRDNSPGMIDNMPSICALASLTVSATCSGLDFSPAMRGEKGTEPASQFIMHISKVHAAGGEKHPAPLFRGVTTGRHTYALYPDRPWCLFDNQADPYQLKNLIDDPALAGVRDEMRSILAEWLKKTNDPFVMPA